MRVEQVERYCVVIPSYSPPTDILHNMLKYLISLKYVNTYIVDSSPVGVFTALKDFVDTLQNEPARKSSIKIFHVENLGVGYSLNFGVQQGISDHCSLISILDDDTILNQSEFDVGRISTFFFERLDPSKDMLILAKSGDRKREQLKEWVETGMTFSPLLFETLQFRENFILDQIDVDFSNKTRTRGGRILLYPYDVLDNLPVGRNVQNGITHLPLYRVYTFSRNSLIIALESPHRVLALFGAAYKILHCGHASLKGGVNLIIVARAILLGVFDGIKGKLGVTRNLILLSGDRFVAESSKNV